MLKPGDFILVDGVTTISRLISFGQRIRFTGEKARYAKWSHVGLIETSEGGTIEAFHNGIRRGNVDAYKDLNTCIVSIDDVATEADRAKVVRFAQHFLGTKYSYTSYIGLGLWALTGADLSFGLNSHMLCSGLVARALERTSAIFPRDAQNLAPAHLAEYFEVKK